MMVPWKKLIDVKANAVMGSSMVTLSKKGCYYKECSLGNFVADAYVFYVSWLLILILTRFTFK